MGANDWNAMSFEGRDTVLRVVRHEAAGFYALAERQETWEGPTGCSEWDARDIVGHLVDTTETYFERFDAARSGAEVPPAYGLPGMGARAGERGRSFRDVPQADLIERARADFDKMMGIFEGLSAEDWTGLLVPHFYMGPLPAFFYPAFQLMDYGVHSWDLRQGTGQAHGLNSEAADLLVPFMFVLWSATTSPSEASGEVGIRVTTGPNAGDTLVRYGPDGFNYEAAGLEKTPAIIEFDPGSFVLTAFGRGNAGTIRGDRAAAEQFLNLFFRI